nr:unnamed protein product [Callosobruchus chinensis]
MFPNLTIALKMMLSLPVTIASRERSFSSLKIIKNYLLTSMYMKDIRKEFASIKARNVDLF